MNCCIFWSLDFFLANSFIEFVLHFANFRYAEIFLTIEQQKKKHWRLFFSLCGEKNDKSDEKKTGFDFDTINEFRSRFIGNSHFDCMIYIRPPNFYFFLLQPHPSFI